ncbi:MAG: PIN domain-containing protein [Nitrososphaerales archaeon]
MKLIVDTNILLGALIKNSTTRSILLNPNHEFYVPEFAKEEVAKHFDLISSKSGLPVKEIKLLFDIIATNLQIVPLEEFRESFGRAEEVMLGVDLKDVPFLALALSIECNGIWSNDRDMKEQKLIRVWNAIELMKVLDRA